MKLQVLPLSQEAFSAYGDVIETQNGIFSILTMAWWSVTTIWRWLRFLRKTVRLSALTARNRRICR